MLIDLAHIGFIQISGAGATQLLQGQFTCNINEISATQSRLGAHCTPQGRIQSLFRVCYFQDAYYLQLPQEILPGAMTALQKYAPFFKVTLEDKSDTLHSLRYQGSALQQLVPELPTTTDATCILDDNTLIIKVPGVDLYDIIGQASTLKKMEVLLDTPLETDNLNAWKLTQIAAGIPTLYITTVGKFLPHEINLPEINAVSFNKGCYTGQEIIARMHYRGQRKKHMYRARVKTSHPPTPGSDIYQDTPCGIIVDSCKENDFYSQLLVIANQTDVENQQLFLDPDKILLVESPTLPY